MSLALHYWMWDAHHCSGPPPNPVSEMTYTVLSGMLNPSILTDLRNNVPIVCPRERPNSAEEHAYGGSYCRGLTKAETEHAMKCATETNSLRRTVKEKADEVELQLDELLLQLRNNHYVWCLALTVCLAFKVIFNVFYLYKQVRYVKVVAKKVVLSWKIMEKCSQISVRTLSVYMRYIINNKFTVVWNKPFDWLTDWLITVL